jgi:hypothetical protein
MRRQFNIASRKMGGMENILGKYRIAGNVKDPVKTREHEFL